MPLYLPSQVSYGTYANRPTIAAAGSRYITSDGPVEFVYTGSVWAPVINGVVGVEVAASNSTSAFSSYNNSDATITAVGGCIFQNNPTSNASTQKIQGWEVSRSSGQTVTACVLPMAYPQSGDATHGLFVCGIYVRDSSGGHVELLGLGSDVGGEFYTHYLDVDKYNSATSYSSSPFKQSAPCSPGVPIWLRIRDDTSNFNYEWSKEGKDWQTLLTESLSGSPFVATPNKFGFYVHPYNVKGSMTILSWNVA